jgi:hypothetical protein
MFKKTTKWLGGRLWDLTTNNATIVITWVAGGGLMFYLGSITEWAKAFGPLGWALIAVGAATLLSFGYWVLAKAINGTALRKFAQDKISARAINTLAPTHNYERINLSDFYSPFFFANENIQFTDCELYGPALMGIDSVSFHSLGFIDCEIVICRDDRAITGAMMFKNCHFLRGKIIRATFIMNHKTYLTLPQMMRDNVRVISDGRIGDV